MGPICTVKFNFNYKLVVSCDRKIIDLLNIHVRGNLTYVFLTWND